MDTKAFDRYLQVMEFADKHNLPDEFIKEMLYGLAYVSCHSCRSLWTTGMFQERARSYDDAKVGARVNGWAERGGKVYCPECTQKTEHD